MVSKQITLAHGSGGKDSAELMQHIFGKYFSNPTLNKLEDAAIVNVGSDSDRIAVSTDSFVVTPLEFKGGDIGKLSVCGTVNDLLMMGAKPKYLTCGFILETGLLIETLERIVASMAAEAKSAGVQIISGDTKVIDGSGGMYINTSGIGIIPEGIDIGASNLKPNDVVIVSGNLGDHHACILSARMTIENNIKSDCATLTEILDTLMVNDIRVKAMRDVTRGGLGTVLNELAVSSDVSIELEEDSIPVADDVKGFADLLGLDPMYMGNEGKMVIIVDSNDAEKALQYIRKTTLGKDARIIGKVLDKKKELPNVSVKTRLGGTRKIDVLYGEGLPRIC